MFICMTPPKGMLYLLVENLDLFPGQFDEHKKSMFLPKEGVAANLTGESMIVTELHSFSRWDSCVKGHHSYVARVK